MANPFFKKNCKTRSDFQFRHPATNQIPLDAGRAAPSPCLLLRRKGARSLCLNGNQASDCHFQMTFIFKAARLPMTVVYI